MSEWFYKKLSWFCGCLAVAFLFGLIVFVANVEIKDMDLWLHLAVGKYIAQTFSIPTSDIFSSTIVNAPWINHEWLFQTIVYSVYQSAGIEGLVNLKVGIVFLSFAVLLFLGYSRERQLGPLVILLLVLMVYQLRMTLRPDMFSLLFLSLYVAILGLHLDKRWALWAIVFLQIIWSNMHGFFILGPITILIVLMGEWMKRDVKLPFDWNRVGRLSDEEFRQLRRLLFAAVLACLVNPNFLKGAWYPLGIFFSLGNESKIFFQEIQELRKPLHWGTVFSWQPYLHYKLLILVSFFGFWFNRRKIDVSVFFFCGFSF